MKKSIAIFLIVSLTAPFAGTYFFIHYSKNKISKEIAGMILNGLDEKTLVQLKFTDEESETILNWKHAGEFEYNGQMYDIVEKHRKGDTIFYNCYKDHKETKLKKDLARTVSKALGHDPGRKSQNEKIVSFMKSILSQDFYTWVPFSPEASTIQFSTFNFQLSTFILSPPSPPPKCC